MLHVVLVAPQIAANTGNIVRLCANAGAALHLVEPLGFDLDDRRLRRAGLDYHELAEVSVDPDLRSCLSRLGAPGARCYAVSGRGERRYDQVIWGDDDVVVFGAEQTGLPAEVLATFPPDRRVAIPMRPANRSLNLANAVAVVVFEAWRQAGFGGAADGSSAHVVGSLAESPASQPYGPG